MSVSISGTTITMTRGDTLRATVLLEDEQHNQYIPQEGDRIRFAMKKAYNDEEPLIVKPISIEDLELVLNPEDTKDLPQPSNYVYDIELTYANGDVDTFISKAKLKLTEEVH